MKKILLIEDDVVLRENTLLDFQKISIKFRE